MSLVHDDHSRNTGTTAGGYPPGAGGYNGSSGHAGAGDYAGAGTNMSVGAGAAPHANIYLRPIAPPGALGLAAYAGSTWIVSSWLAGWWGGLDSPLFFFPFVMLWGGLAQFIAGLKGFHARDALLTVFHTLWGSFWLATGVLWLATAAGAVPLQSLSLRTHFPELASWAVVLMVFTWICAIASFARDMVLFATFTTAALGSTLATGGWYSYGSRASITVKAASYFLMLSSALAAYRVAAFLFEENFGRSALPIFRTRREKATASVSAGYGEPGVKRGEPNQPHHDGLNDSNGAGVAGHRGGGAFNRKNRPSGETAA